MMDYFLGVALVVEDALSIQAFLKILLTPDHQIIQAFSADQAIELAQVTPLDLVLLDLGLQTRPDNLEVCRTLRKNPDPSLARVPIVILTSETSEGNIRAALGAGATSYLGKPYSPSALLSLIDTLLVKRGV